ncbi:hypothetical protein QFC22_006250 [Naganishia vaughanmartiniae]|uniref:Uncharacterized protein n=1 Tax=Naganishia vaughanmartiniae TaxID=1424756 RepID=A0ACC2WM69_9TREE|nr:hypothetical protein QFC22_006250 [Naganishia vaughanmartiniae]
MDVQDNKAGLSQGQGQLVTKPGWFIFPAAELAFATALAPCFVGACDVQAIIGFFQNYIEDSEAAIKQDVKALFNPWTSAVDNLSGAFAGLGNVTQQVGERVAQTEADVRKLLNDFCGTPEVCASNTLMALKSQGEMTRLAKQIAELNTIVTSATTSLHQIGDVIHAGSDAIDAVSDLGLSAIVQKVQEGSFRNLAELAGALKAAQHLPDIIKNVQQQGNGVLNVVNELKNKGPQFVDSVQKIVGQNWLADYQGSDAAAAQRLTQQVQKIQDLMMSLVPHATQLWAQATFLVDSLGSVSAARDLDVQLDLGLASYQRYTKGWFYMPCLTTGKQPYNLFGFKGSVDYPKFYPCKQKYNVPFPNQHIPYARLRMPGDSLLARLGGKLPSGSMTAITRVTAQASAADVTQTTSAAPSTIAAAQTTTSSFSVSSVDSTSSTSSSISSSTTSSTVVSTSNASESTSSVVTTDSTTAQQTTSPASTITAAPIRRDRRRPDLTRRQSDGEEDAPDVIPPDTSLSAALPSDVYTDSAQVEAASRETLPSTVLYFSTTIDGRPTTTQAGATPTGAPESTETVDDLASATELSFADSFELYTDLTTASLDSAMTTWQDVATVSIDTATPTLAGASATMQATAAASASVTAGAVAASGAERVSYTAWMQVICVLAGVRLMV